MKKGIFLLLVAAFGSAVQAQSLKDLLYSGKLKNDSNTVIRKTDDLSSKIDTTTKKVVMVDSVKQTSPKAVTAATAPPSGAVETVQINDTAAATVEAVVPEKNNTAIWKSYMDSVISSFKTELLPNRKVKKETYYLMVQYEIGTDGQVSINNVLSTPENEFLQSQIKERLSLTAPQLSPVEDSSQTARKVKKKYSFTLTKE